MADLAYLDLLARSISRCQKCPLAKGRTCAIPGHGSPSAKAVLVCELPRKEDDLSGKPLQGKVGAQLEKVLSAVGLSRRDFFITPLVKCKPAYGHDLTLAELQACAPYLDAQLEALDPSLLVLAGRHTVSTWFPGEKIGTLHGKPRTVWKPWTVPEGSPQHLVVIPVYHPSATLFEDGVPLDLCIQDFHTVAGLLHDLKEGRAA